MNSSYKHSSFINKYYLGRNLTKVQLASFIIYVLNEFFSPYYYILPWNLNTGQNRIFKFRVKYVFGLLIFTEF